MNKKPDYQKLEVVRKLTVNPRKPTEHWGGTGFLPTLDFFPHLWVQTVHHKVIDSFVYVKATHERQYIPK
jgi:hypothetical protein